MATSGVAFRPEEPNVARMYDYMLGGKDNFPADREAARRTFDVLGEDVVRGTVRALFGGRPLEDPGEVVWTAQWHPDANTPPVDSPRRGVTVVRDRAEAVTAAAVTR